jgi:hypothetical protein
MKLGLAAAAIALAAVITTSAANAAVVIGYSLDGGGVIPVGVGPDGAAYSGSFGDFDVNLTGSDTGTLPSILESFSLNVDSAGTPGVLNIFITDTDLTAPLGSVTFTSAFGVDQLIPGWTVQEQTFLDPTNGFFGLTNALGSSTFYAPGSVSQDATADAGVGPYSVTEQYTITAPTAGLSVAHISLSVSEVPEAATWAMFLVGFGALGAALRMRRAAALA